MQKKYNQRYNLTLLRSEGRWRKRYKGRNLYFPIREGESISESYHRALQELKQKKREIDKGEVENDPHRKAWLWLIDEARKRQAVCEEEDTLQNRAWWLYWQGQIKSFRWSLEEGIAFFDDPEDISPAKLDDYLQSWGVGPDCMDQPPPWATEAADTQGPSSLRAVADDYLKVKRNEVEDKAISPRRYDFIKTHLEEFVAFIGGGEVLVSINGSLLERYRNDLQNQVRNGKPSPSYARDRLQVVKQFFKWAWRTQRIEELPRILDKDFTITVPNQAPTTFTVEEIKQLLDGASEQTQLYLLLCLNCGMRQGDIAALQQSEVDWKAGRIRRKRTKTKDKENVPVVDYLLWEETARLLRKYRSDHPELALTNENGGPLKSDRFIKEKENGKEVEKVKRIDNIRSAYARLQKKLGLTGGKGKPLAALRATASTMLDKHSEFGRYAQFFLGHAPRTIADKHYVKPSGEQFDRAVVWLGEQFGQGTD